MAQKGKDFPSLISSRLSRVERSRWLKASNKEAHCKQVSVFITGKRKNRKESPDSRSGITNIAPKAMVTIRASTQKRAQMIFSSERIGSSEEVPILIIGIMASEKIQTRTVEKAMMTNGYRQG